jgi:hypothetical protein
MLVAEDPAPRLQCAPQQSLGVLEATIKGVTGGGEASSEQSVVVIVTQDAPAKLKGACEHSDGLATVAAVEAVAEMVHGGQGLWLQFAELAALDLEGRLQMRLRFAILTLI